MRENDDDDAWRAIVDNYGDRPAMESEEPAPPRAEPVAEPVDDPWATRDDTDLSGPSSEGEERTWDNPDSDWSTDRFVPPPPPPVPTTTRDRRAAWLGVFGGPSVLLASLLIGLELPQFVAYLLVGSFVGGFVYLVVQMPRGPRDPGDDGARL